MKTLLCVGMSDAARFLALRPNFDACYVIDDDEARIEYLAGLFKFDSSVHLTCREAPFFNVQQFCVEKSIEEVDTLVLSLVDRDDEASGSMAEFLREKQVRLVECLFSPGNSLSGGCPNMPGMGADGLVQALDEGYERKGGVDGNKNVFCATWVLKDGRRPAARGEESARRSHRFNFVYFHLADKDWQICRRGNVSMVHSSAPVEGCDLYLYLDAFSYRGKQKGYDLLLLSEPIVVLPGQYNTDIWNHFAHVFTLYDHLIEGDERFTKTLLWRYGWPPENAITEDMAQRETLYPIKGRQNSICMINGNKVSWVSGELYSKRIDAALWFCTNSDLFFDVYGRPPYLLPNYKGSVDNDKRLFVLSRYRYNWCFENTDHPVFGRGYVDKILDCLETRTVPIYLGNPNIEKYVPKECFIDFRDFGSYAAVNDYLHRITEDEYMTYVENIDRWVSNGGLRPYSWQTLYDQLTRWYSTKTGIDFRSLVGEETTWERERGIPRSVAALPTPWTFDDLRFRPSQFMSQNDILEATTAHPLKRIAAECDGRVRRAVELASSGAYYEAVKEIALCGYTGAADPHYISAQVMHLAGLQDPVLVQLYTALAIDPDHSYAHNQLGVVLFERKEHKKAEAAFRRAVELDGSNHLARKNLALLLLQTGRREEAIPMFKSVEPYFPEEVRALGL